MKSPIEELLELSAEIAETAKSLCIACQWSGVDDTIYRAHGCPACSCRKDLDNMLRLYAHARNTMKAKDEMIRVMYEALNTLKVAVNDKQPDLGATLFISRTLQTCNQLAKEALEKK